MLFCLFFTEIKYYKVSSMIIEKKRLYIKSQYNRYLRKVVKIVELIYYWYLCPFYNYFWSKKNNYIIGTYFNHSIYQYYMIYKAQAPDMNLVSITEQILWHESN